MTAALTRPRDATLDGIRGVALVLIVLSHGWALWPIDRIDDGTPWGNLVRSGNLGVTVFFVAGAYLAVDGLIRLGSRAPASEYARTTLRRIVRISTPIAVLLVAVVVTATLDSTDTTPPETTRNSVWAISTFTWNWYLINSSYTARADLGHLWYVSVFVQVILFLTVLLFITRRRLWVFAIVVGTLLSVVIAWRWHLSQSNPANEISDLLRTSTRSDGFLWGALVAVTRPWWSRLALRWEWVLAIGTALLAILALTVGNDVAYFRWPGQLMALGSALAIMGAVACTDPSRITRALGWRPLAWLGENSLTIFAWHYPIFFFVARHTTDWSWPARTALGLGLTALASVALIRWIERPLAKAVRRWPWTRPSAPAKTTTQSVDSL